MQCAQQGLAVLVQQTNTDNTDLLLSPSFACRLLLSAPTDTISELKLGNGTSVLIFANIASSLPTSVGALLAQNTESNPTNVAIYATAFFLTTLGIIYVQEAERRIPVNYSSRYKCAERLLALADVVCLQSISAC